MTNEWDIPSDRDLPPGRLAQRREHLVSEIRRENHASRREARAPRPRRSLVRTLTTAAVAAGVIGAVLLGFGLGESATAKAQIEVDVAGEYYEIRFVEMAEDASVVNQELAALGLDVEIDFISVSPSLEGTLVASGGGDGREEYLLGASFGPTPEVRLPLDYDAHLTLTIGRPASDGEAYVSSPALGAIAPGEALHCVQIFNMPVEVAATLFKERGLVAQWRSPSNEIVSFEAVEGYFVSDAVPLAPGELIVWTHAQPFDEDPRSAEVLAYLRAGCDGRESR